MTSGFINDVLDGYGDSNFTTLRITGASLGGGLAIISGAQTGVAAVAISGLGAELSRHTLNPPVTLAQINEHVFNWIPDRDYIARSKRMKGGACLVIKLVCLGVFADILHRLLSHFCLLFLFLTLQLEAVLVSTRRRNAKRLRAVYLVVTQCGAPSVRLPTDVDPTEGLFHADVSNGLDIPSLCLLGTRIAHSCKLARSRRRRF